MVKVISKEEASNFSGYQAEPTDWHNVTQDQINQFADCTLDHQFIHVDPEAAKNGPFGTTIAHGFLSLSMLSHFAESYSLLIDGAHTFINYGFDKVRFLTPVKVDGNIRAVANVVDITEKKPGQFVVKTQVTVEIEGETKPALVAEWISMQIC